MSRRLPMVVCGDGTELSIQAGRYYESNPKIDDACYSHVEVFIPRGLKLPESWDACYDGYNPVGYVPVELVWELIEAHGGIVSGYAPLGVCPDDPKPVPATNQEENND